MELQRERTPASVDDGLLLELISPPTPHTPWHSQSPVAPPSSATGQAAPLSPPESTLPYCPRSAQSSSSSDDAISIDSFVSDKELLDAMLLPAVRSAELPDAPTASNGPVWGHQEPHCRSRFRVRRPEFTPGFGLEPATMPRTPKSTFAWLVGEAKQRKSGLRVPKRYIRALVFVLCILVWIRVIYKSSIVVRRSIWMSKPIANPAQHHVIAHHEPYKDTDEAALLRKKIEELQAQVAHHEASSRRDSVEVDKGPEGGSLSGTDALNRLTFYGQEGGGHNMPDRIVFEKFFAEPEPLRDGVFVEVGAQDGVDRSNTLFFEENLGWRGLLVEGATPNFKKLLYRRSKALKIHSAVCAKAGHTKFLGDGGTAGDPRFLSQDHIKKWSRYWVEPWTTAYEVPCYPMTDLLAKARIKQIDFLSIDVEGAEYEVLKTMDWKKTPVRVMLVETSGNKQMREFIHDKANMCLAFSVASNDYYVSRADPLAKEYCK
mmetsp:Transcript_26127/g.63465  ORF Transcript_26127/g.63465 Transcript_26127/m.63465 type:complete len:488 (-) Transcript_26127:419-1882(-)